MAGLNIGDTIKCSTKYEMVQYMYKLQDDGYATDFIYEKDGVKGYWLEVTDTYKQHTCSECAYLAMDYNKHMDVIWSCTCENGRGTKDENKQACKRFLPENGGDHE